MRARGARGDHIEPREITPEEIVPAARRAEENTVNEYRVTHFVRVTTADGAQRTFPLMAETASEAADTVAMRIGPVREVEVWEAGAGPFCFAPTIEPVKAPS